MLTEQWSVYLFSGGANSCGKRNRATGWVRNAQSRFQDWIVPPGCSIASKTRSVQLTSHENNRQRDMKTRFEGKLKIVFLIINKLHFLFCIKEEMSAKMKNAFRIPEFVKDGLSYYRK